MWGSWIDEGDAVGTLETGEEWGFRVGRRKPRIYPGHKLYIVAFGKLRGYAPVLRVAWNEYEKSWMICRRGNAVAVTIPHKITGFRGFRNRWWDEKSEIDFPDWKNPNAQFPDIN